MLQHLFIKDLAIIASVDLNFDSGMTVITGETGAGKSILLDALQLALGGRSDSQLVRPGAERAEIAATFDVTSLPSAVLWLSDLELTCQDSPQQCVIRRILYANGRSRALINGLPATTQQLRLLGEHLVQIHGQHQHQLLLKASEQLRLLDAFGQHDTLVSQVKTLYLAWDKLMQQYQYLESQSQAHAHSDLLQYQIAELEALSLQENEVERLHQEHDKLAHANNLITACDEALQHLCDNEEANALTLLDKAIKALSPWKQRSPSLSNASECLSNARIQCQEGSSEITRSRDQLDIDPQRLTLVESRLEELHDMARKHHVEAKALGPHLASLQAQMAAFSDAASQLTQLKNDMSLYEKQYTKTCATLTKAREKTAERLAKEMTARIRQLGMPGAEFTATLTPQSHSKPHPKGEEGVVFGISANPGHPPQPLTKVASGGELSRISLALELIAAKYIATPCLIFDEVDVGISGKIGAIVGKALDELSQSSQVVCITHLPQVAAFGKQHMQVSKKRSKQTTQTQIGTLNQECRIEEIARMLGGLETSDKAREHARELLTEKEAVTLDLTTMTDTV